MLMIFITLFVLGLILGSFVNALIWRIHEQEKKDIHIRPNDLSVVHGRSMCPKCMHKLSNIDLIPIFSWLSLGGKCRYCKKRISIQYPLVEITTALLFIFSYIWWPSSFDTVQYLLFILWLLLVTGFMALIVYDIRWYLLPNRIIYPLFLISILFALISILSSNNMLSALFDTLIALIIGGGIFYIIFQISKGKWIGGGDVRLGWLLGLLAGTPSKSFLFIFIASLLGTLFSLPLLASKRLKKNQVIPFGPFLIAGLYITQLFGNEILDWYQNTFLNL